MAEPYTSSISNSALEKINRMMLQRKAAGKRVEPWEIEAAYKAALSTEADRASTNYFKGRELNLEEQRMNDARQANQDALDASKTSGMVGVAQNALLLNQMMADKTTGNTPLGNMYRGLRGTKNPTPTPGTNPTNPGGVPEYVGPGVNEVPGGLDTVSPPTTPVDVPSTTIPTPGPEVYPVNTVDPTTGQLIGEGLGTGEVAGAGLSGNAGAIDAASGLSSADLAAMTAENATAGGTAATGSTLGSVASGVGAGLFWHGVKDLGEPYLRKIMEKGTEDLWGAEPDSSNVFSQMNRIAMDDRGLITPAYEEITGNEMPEIVQGLTNPAGVFLRAGNEE